MKKIEIAKKKFQAITLATNELQKIKGGFWIRIKKPGGGIPPTDKNK